MPRSPASISQIAHCDVVPKAQFSWTGFSRRRLSGQLTVWGKKKMLSTMYSTRTDHAVMLHDARPSSSLPSGTASLASDFRSRLANNTPTVASSEIAQGTDDGGQRTRSRIRSTEYGGPPSGVLV